jgi:hypothetical protein
MMNKFAPLSSKVAALLHGADYNPEQWENYPGIIEKDIAMMKQAKCNVMSVGIFSWAKLEPPKGNMISPGWTVLLKNFMRRVFIFSWRRQPAHVRHGCRKNTRKCCAWGATACLHCMAGVITTA